MAHDKIYGICDNKCQVRLPRILSYTDSIGNVTKINSKELYPFSTHITDNITDGNWTVYASLTLHESANIAVNYLQVTANLNTKREAIYIGIYNTESSSVTLPANTKINYTLIEHV